MKIFMVAGEASGDTHGYNLALELMELYPNIELLGTGGDKLASLGQKQLFTDKDMAIIGFDGVIKKLPFIFKMFSVVEKAVKDETPDVIILVDYPGFNLRLAKKLKKYGIPIIYFVSPQFWVWNYKRIYTLRDYVDLTISIYPFESEPLKKAGVNSIYVGNPIIDNIKFAYKDKSDFFTSNNLDINKPLIGILPGSRAREVSSLIPSFVEASHHYGNKYQFIVSRADSISEDLMANLVKDTSIKYLSGSQYDIMKYSDFLWACSGTVTLEAAIMEKPCLITYRSSAFNFFIAKRLSNLRMVGLPNIMAGHEIMPEILGTTIEPAKVIAATEKSFANLDNIKKELKIISNQFVGMTPCKTAAQEIYSLLQNRQF